MTRRSPRPLRFLALLACGCSAGGGGTAGLSEGGGETTPADASSTTDASTNAPGSSSGIDEPDDTSSSGDDGPKLDVGPGEDTEETGDPPMKGECDGKDLAWLDIDQGAPPCMDQGPPDAFEPVLEWAYPTPESGLVLGMQTIPLVVNFTDDDDNGTIDMCDTPDVILKVWNLAGFDEHNPPMPTPDPDCEIHVVDGRFGESGLVHTVIEHDLISCSGGGGTGAVADIDVDGRPDIVVTARDYRLLAFANDGSVLWHSDPLPEDVWLASLYPFDSDYGASGSTWWHGGAVFVGDMNADGSPEILVNHALYDAEGHVLWAVPEPLPTFFQSSIMVDLDDDGRLEVVTAHGAWRFDGDWQPTQLWDLIEDPIQSVSQRAAIPHVADLDDNGDPEILLARGDGYWVLDHDGSPWTEIPFVDVGALPAPEGGPWPCEFVPDCCLADPECSVDFRQSMNWEHFMRPGVLADMAGLGRPQFAAAATTNNLSVWSLEDTEFEQLWTTNEVDESLGASGVSAFDFLADGTAELLYSDSVRAYAYSGLDGEWSTAMSVDRFSNTSTEYPVVADLDDDGSAEFLVVSLDVATPVLQVFGEVENRWVGARRIWNQQAYSITNVNEDGSIPQAPVDNWDFFNNFRTQMPLEGGAICIPPVPRG